MADYKPQVTMVDVYTRDGEFMERLGVYSLMDFAEVTGIVKMFETACSDVIIPKEHRSYFVRCNDGKFYQGKYKDYPELLPPLSTPRTPGTSFED